MVGNSVALAIDAIVEVLEHAEVEQLVVIEVALSPGHVDIIVALLRDDWLVAVSSTRYKQIRSVFVPILRLEVLSNEVDREACLGDLVLNLLVCELIGGPLVFDCLRKVDFELQRRAIQCVTF